MKIRISNNSNAKWKNFSVQKIYDVIINVEPIEIDRVVLNHIIAWLPSIAEITVCFQFENDFLDICFTNNETIRLYNTGIEDVLFDLIDKE